MWIVDTKKYSGILSTIIGLNNIVNLCYNEEKSVGMLKVSTPSRVGYAELLVPELNDKIDKLFDLKPLVSMFSSKVATEVFFSPPAQLAMYKRPYFFQETIPEMDNQEEWGGIREAEGIPDAILQACAGTNVGVYKDSDNNESKVALLNLDNVIFIDMARRLGAPRTILTISAGPDGLVMKDAEGRTCKYPKPKDDIYPDETVEIMLSMETQPMVFGSLLGKRSRVYIVDSRFVMIDAAQGVYTFLCAAYAGGHTDFEGYEI